MNLKIFTPILGIGLFLSPMAPLAAQNADTLPIVEVQSTSTFENPTFTEKEKAEPVKRVVYDEVKLQNSSAENLADFLAEQGIAIMRSPTDYGHTLLSIRGFRTDHLSKELDGHVLFLIDGHRSGTNNPTQISLNNVERVEILRGPEMLRYSAASPGGIINVITKKGGPDKLAGSLEIGAGSYDFYKTQLKLNGLVEGFDYSLGYVYSERGDYNDATGALIDNSKTAGMNAVNLNFGYTFNELHRIGWSTYYYKLDKAYRPAYTDANENILYGPSYTNRLNTSNTLSYDGKTADERFVWQASYTFGENWFKQYSLGANDYPMSAKFEKNIFDASLTFKNDLWTITGGLEYLDYDTEEGKSSSNINKIHAFGNPQAPTGRFENLAGYLVADLKLLEEKLIFSGALRYDHYKVSDKRQDLPGDVGNTNTSDCQQDPTCNRLNGPLPWGQTYNHLSPSLGVSYIPLEWLKLRANYTQTFRPPSPRELTSASYEPYGFWGYPWNKAEKTNTYETGFDINIPNFNFSTTYFYSFTKDYVYQHTHPAQDHQRVRNAEKQYRNGIELQLSGNVAGALGYENFELLPYFGLSHLFKKEEQYLSSYVGPGNFANYLPLNQIVDTTLSYGLRFRHPESKFRATLNFNYYGHEPYTVSQTNPNIFYTKSYTVADLSLRKGLIEFENIGDLELKLDINNLFNEHYNPSAASNPDYKSNYPSNNIDPRYYNQGRNFYAGIVFNF